MFQDKLLEKFKLFRIYNINIVEGEKWVTIH